MSKKGHTADEKESNMIAVDNLIRKCPPTEQKAKAHNSFWVRINLNAKTAKATEEGDIDNARQNRRKWKEVAKSDYPGGRPVLKCYHSKTIGDLFKNETVNKIKDKSGTPN